MEFSFPSREISCKTQNNELVDVYSTESNTHQSLPSLLKRSLACPSSNKMDSSSPPNHENTTKLFIVVGLLLLTVLFILAYAIAGSCCSWLHHFIILRRILGRQFCDEDVQRWMPTYSYAKRKEDEGVVDAECAICLSAFEEGEEMRRMWRCGHFFHAYCIDKWLNSHNSCPVCRNSILPIPLPLQSMEMPAAFFDQRDHLPSSSLDVP